MADTTGNQGGGADHAAVKKFGAMPDGAPKNVTPIPANVVKGSNGK